MIKIAMRREYYSEIKWEDLRLQNKLNELQNRMIERAQNRQILFGNNPDKLVMNYCFVLVNALSCRFLRK